MVTESCIANNESRTRSAHENRDTLTQNGNGPPLRHTSPIPSYRHFSISSAPSSPPPPKRRRTSPPKAAMTKEPQRASNNGHQETRGDPSNRTLFESLQPYYLGDFIAEAWATTSDTKTNTYVHPGDRILISRSDSDSLMGLDAPSKSKGIQTKLGFEPKAKSKKSWKENNIVRFLNSKGSGENLNVY